MSSALHSHDAGGPAALVEVDEGIYAYVQPDGSWWINNTGFLVGRRGVISVDSCSTERRTRAYLEAIRGVTGSPVRTLINTHHHGDHTHGNYLFGGATIVAHDTCRQEVIDGIFPVPAGLWEDVDWGAIEIAPPFLTYDRGVTVYRDDLRCEVRYVGEAAHTTNDSIVWIPERSVLFAGDLLFNGGTPFLMMGSVDGAVDVIENVLRPLGAETIVPGHGDVCGPAVLDEVLGYLRFIQATARAGRDAGLTPLATALETDLGRFADLSDSERIVGNLHRAFAELDGAERGAKIDVASALVDMVTYNGGKPLSCSA
ncbi:MAG: MBL fold metallo-hydrolase [Acidimicrobiales bacterium]